jgi:hypothetical protein
MQSYKLYITQSQASTKFFEMKCESCFFHGKIDYLRANVLILKKTKSNKSLLNIFIMGHFRYLFMALMACVTGGKATASTSLPHSCQGGGHELASRHF